MKVHLEFNLPDEDREFRIAQDGNKWRSVLWEFDQWLRSEEKHSDRDKIPVPKLRKKIIAMMADEALIWD